MEADMKSVSIGTKSKAQVLESCLQQMKACFLDVSWKFLVFHDTYREYCNIKTITARKATVLSFKKKSKDSIVTTIGAVILNFLYPNLIA
jgi:hypothetical protein